jgi:hypothetical protein
MAVETSFDREESARQHVQRIKPSMWQSLLANPKVLLIAFFAS